jgi:SAM-dependent methyltransferase
MSLSDLHPTVQAYVANRRIAEEYDAYFDGHPLFAYDVRFLAERLAVRRPGRLLDLGCGTGRHLLPFARAGWEVTGVDLNPHILREAAKKLADAGIPAGKTPGGPNTARLLRADFLRLDAVLADERFDAVLLMFSTLGLVWPESRRRTFLAGLRERIAPGGSVFLHVHNARYRLEPGETPSGDRIMKGYRGILDLYLHSFTRDELLSLFAGCGFRVVAFRPLNDRRDGPCAGPDADREANGFLAEAAPSNDA